MAARNTRSRPRAEEAAAVSTVESDLTATDQPQSLADAFSVTSTADVVLDEDVEALKAADAVDESAETEEQRAEQLQKFLGGETDPAAPEAAPAVEVDLSTAKNFGGDKIAIVLFDYYRVSLREQNLSLVAEKGDLIKVTDKTLKRGVSIGGLKEIEG